MIDQSGEEGNPPHWWGGGGSRGDRARLDRGYRVRRARVGPEIAGVVISLIGLLQLIGFVSGFPAVRAVGGSTAASPLPLVFTDHGNYEDFATDYALDLLLENGERVIVPVTAEAFSRLDGPWDRRGSYAEVFFLVPFLSDAVVSSVIGHGLCRDGPLTTMFDLEDKVRIGVLYVSTKTIGRKDSWAKVVQCPR